MTLPNVEVPNVDMPSVELGPISTAKIETPHVRVPGFRWPYNPGCTSLVQKAQVPAPMGIEDRQCGQSRSVVLAGIAF